MRRTLQADVVNATTAYADVTGLSFPVSAGRVTRFRAIIDYTANATTTGSAWAVNSAAGITRLSYCTRKDSSGTVDTFSNGLATYDADAANAGSAATGANQAVVEGFIKPSADGVVTLRFKASTAVANAITAKAGSTVDYHEVL